jgi:nitrogen fixation-related uncharacterized protein
MVLLISIVLCAVILALYTWASGGRPASDAERTSSWGRGIPS